MFASTPVHDTHNDTGVVNAGSARTPQRGRYVELICYLLHTPFGPVTWQVVVGDMDNDGAPDLLVGNLEGEPNEYFKNVGGYSLFVRRTDTNFSSGRDSTNALALGDYDGDGWLDVVVGNGGRFAGEKNALFRNDGAGGLIAVTSTPVTASSEQTQAVAFGDYDGDGWLDLLVGNGGTGTDGGFQNELFRNDGAGGFIAVIDSPLVSVASATFALAWCDYDSDGWLDVVIGNNGAAINGANQLFRNVRGVFTLVTTTPIDDESGTNTQALAWGDYNSDGLPDLVVGNSDSNGNELFANDGNGGFQRVVDTPITASRSTTTALGWGDYDLDGDLDLIVGDSHGQNSERRWGFRIGSPTLGSPCTDVR